MDFITNAIILFSICYIFFWFGKKYGLIISKIPVIEAKKEYLDAWKNANELAIKYQDTILKHEKAIKMQKEALEDLEEAKRFYYSEQK
jgi:hypothetical protein